MRSGHGHQKNCCEQRTELEELEKRNEGLVEAHPHAHDRVQREQERRVPVVELGSIGMSALYKDIPTCLHTLVARMNSPRIW